MDHGLAEVSPQNTEDEEDIMGNDDNGGVQKHALDVWFDFTLRSAGQG